ncbi:MAG: hypothetical protein GC157_03235 [Frankiales bacterium]|nr:hypothetical protein [Frankiales bacterium]
MKRPHDVRWFRLRLLCVVGVLALLVVEALGHVSPLVLSVQALLVVGIVVTSVLDSRDLRRRGDTAS